MHRHKHLFEQIVAIENLIAAARAALRGKRLRRPGSEFLADFEKEVVALREKLRDGTYRTVLCEHQARRDRIRSGAITDCN